MRAPAASRSPISSPRSSPRGTSIPAPNGSEVTIESSWDGAGGIAGMFEGFFAPRGMRRIYTQVLTKLDAELKRA